MVAGGGRAGVRRRGDPGRDVLDLTAALVDKSLVLREAEALGQARYRMLDTIREYAAGWLVEAGESESLWRRFRDYAVRTAERNLAIGIARTPASWAAPGSTCSAADVEAGQHHPGTELVPRPRRRGGWPADRRRDQPVLDRARHLHRGRRVPGCLRWPSTLRPSTRRSGRGLGARAQLILSSSPAAAESPASEGLKLCRDEGDEFWRRSRSTCSARSRAYRADRRAAAYADDALAVAQSPARVGRGLRARHRRRSRPG